MKTKIELSTEDYNKLCEMAKEKSKSVEDTLMELIDEFMKAEISKVEIKENETKNSR